MEAIPKDKENGNATAVGDIVIVTEKTEKNGIQYRKIVSVEGCLPEKELRGIPGYASGQAIWETKFGVRDEQRDAVQMFNSKSNVPHLVIGEVVREDLFQNALRHIEISLCRLKAIQAKQADKAKWEGEETITVKPVEIC